MGHPDSECLILIFRYHWRHCWACEYQHIISYHIVQSNIYLSGIPTSEHNFYRDWCSSPGPCLSPFPRTTYFDTLAQAAKDARAGRDKLIDLFNSIERFFQRLGIYTRITPTRAMIDIIVDIMVEVLTVLGIATKEVKRGWLSESMLCRFTFLDLTDTPVQKRISGNWL
jgi:hypothetical protein